MKTNLLNGLILFMISMSFTNLKALPPEKQYTGIVSEIGTCDDCFEPGNEIGFTFSFFGSDYTQFSVTSNGLLMFGPGSNSPTNITIPTASTPNNFIAPFWDNLSTSASSVIYYQTIGVAPNRKLIVQWDDMVYSTDGSPFGTFMCILYEGSNEIQIQYRSIFDKSKAQSLGNSATIGLENSGGTSGELYSFNTSDAIYEGMAIRWSPSGGSSYTSDDDAAYEGVVLVADINSPEPGIPILNAPSSNSTVGTTVTFSWNNADDADSYSVLLWDDGETITEANADIYNAGSDLSYELSGLTAGATYKWAVVAINSTDQTLSELRSFTTSATPPLAAVPNTSWVDEGEEIVVTLNFTGGDASDKTCSITSLPVDGSLYQYNNGAHGSEITTPTEVTDANFSVIYVADEGTGNGAGNFNFQFGDDSESDVATQTINVIPLSAPSLLGVTFTSNTIEMSFDQPMAAVAGEVANFSASLNASNNVISSVELKEGDSYTIIANVTDAQTSTDDILISYSPGTVESEAGVALDDFTDAEATLAAQTINFTAITPKTFGDPDFSLMASATPSGLGVTFKSSNTSIINISGTGATVNNAGTVTITAFQSGDDDYGYVQSIQTITVAQATPEITEAPTAEDIIEADAISESLLSEGTAMFAEKPVNGQFVFAYPDSVPPSGDYYTTVTFIPTDENYSEVTIVIPLVVLVDTDGDGEPNITDTDDDNDGILDTDDDLPLDDTESVDTDGDGIGNNADTDDDGDGVLDVDDDFPLDATETVDTDGDEIGDNADIDDDNDDVLDVDDDFPLDENESVDTDGDGIGNNTDLDDDDDGTPDTEDAFPLNGDEDEDTDGDGIGNNSDPDDDNDNLTDLEEASLGTDRLDPDTDGDDVNDDIDDLPLDPTETIDTDGDGIGNNADTDDDGDGVIDTEDDFPLDANETTDTDGDGTGDNEDTDDDDDGIIDTEDDFPLDANETTDTDGDGTGDNEDTDDDGDGIIDTEDDFPLDANETIDTDGDGTGDNEDTDDDGDGVIDTEDDFPLDENETTDTDDDGTGNNEDTDDDDDGVQDINDDLPLNPNETIDTDDDGIGNNEDTDDDDDGVLDTEDDFPLNPNESIDTDGDGTGNNEDTDDDDDGVLDAEDDLPLNPNETIDTDSDGIGNNEDTDDDGDDVIDSEDAFPLDGNETIDTDGDGTGNNADTDDDGDGVLDTEDDFPLDENETIDTDGDGVGDNSDAFPNDAAEDTDSDEDGTGDNSDAFPLNPYEDTDTDGDGTGNNADIDDDNDSVIDAEDAFPIDPSESKDTDNNGIGNNADTDDDGDGVADDVDAFPLNPNETIDTDNDGIGNNADTDDDNDSVIDIEDAYPLDPTRTTGIDKNAITNLEIYPNPVQDFLVISTESEIIERIKLYDITGKIFIDNVIKKDKSVIDVSKFKHGIYMIEVETNKGKAIYKIFKN